MRIAFLNWHPERSEGSAVPQAKMQIPRFARHAKI